MINIQNHVIDPSYFYDAIEEFSFNYQLYSKTEKVIDDYGRVTFRFTNYIIRGSLQSEGTRINRSKDGNTTELSYKFYCKSLYRISIGDFILYKNNWMIVEEVQDYDEYGVREATLKGVQLIHYKDLLEYVKYLQGDILV